jgi:hypothetical protein
VSSVGKVLTFTSSFTAVKDILYDSTVAWISTNELIKSLSCGIDNPHATTASQYASAEAVQVRGTNTGDQIYRTTLTLSYAFGLKQK